MEQGYKLRRFIQSGGVYFSIGLPAEIGKQLDPEIRFEVELTERGILFVPRSAETPEVPADWKG